MSPSAPTLRAAGTSPAREALADAAPLAVDAALTVGAALRITRFATTDVLGGWALSDPLHRWASRHEPGRPFGYLAPPEAWRHRLVSALDCPFCVGTQATLLLGAALAATSSSSPTARHGRRSTAGLLIRAACATLGAAYVVGHVSHRLDTPAATPAPARPQTAPTASPAPTAKDSK